MNEQNLESFEEKLLEYQYFKYKFKQIIYGILVIVLSILILDKIADLYYIISDNIIFQIVIYFYILMVFIFMIRRENRKFELFLYELYNN